VPLGGHPNHARMVWRSRIHAKCDCKHNLVWCLARRRALPNADVRALVRETFRAMTEDSGSGLRSRPWKRPGRNFPRIPAEVFDSFGRGQANQIIGFLKWQAQLAPGSTPWYFEVDEDTCKLRTRAFSCHCNSHDPPGDNYPTLPHKTFYRRTLRGALRPYCPTRRWVPKPDLGRGQADRDTGNPLSLIHRKRSYRFRHQPQHRSYYSCKSVHGCRSRMIRYHWYWRRG